MEYTKQIEVIRELAKRVKEISEEPQYSIKRQKWADHNELDKKTEPLFWICPDDDGVWLELLPLETLKTEDPDLRVLEQYLRRLVYHHDHFFDDFVIEPVARFDLPGEYTGYHYGNSTQKTAWGIEIKSRKIGHDAYHLDDPAHVETLLQHEVDFIPDDAELQRLKKNTGRLLAESLTFSSISPM